MSSRWNLATREELQRAGYHFEVSRPCRRCATPLEFWRSPKNRLCPLEVLFIDGVWCLGSHFASCPAADEFRKKTEPRPPAAQKGLFS